ncbi:dynein regulatory complex subunit 4 [Nematolebias whitei]|uniref:dynein regulatory complex subunit 4 n=1 Tax=Nematolebias whitei TaxID=451745 RepID=UPI00189B9F74|nr:dynein regulatory complex subunit 4 [Nematolebias whitei]
MGSFSTEEMSKDQLEEHIVLLREELDREREERSFFQLERDQIRASWEIYKRDVEEFESELRNRVREKDEAEERHRAEITIYKQKLKHVLSEQHNTVSEMKMDTVSSVSTVQDQNTESELGLRRDVQNLQMDRRQKKFNEECSITELKLRHQVELMELNNMHDRRLREMEVKYHHRMQALVQAEEKRWSSEVSKLEEQMKSRMTSVVEHQDRILRETQEYVCKVPRKLLNKRQILEKEHAELQKHKVHWNNKLPAVQKENKRLKKVLQETQQKLLNLPRQNRAIDIMEKHRAHLQLVEQQLRDLTVEHQQLLQAFQEVQQERDELLRQQTKSLLEVQQRRGLKKMVLEEKLAVLTETLEKKEAQLSATLSVSNIDPRVRSTAANQLEETLESKRVAMEALKEDLVQQCKEYDQLLHSWKEQLEASGRPLRHLPIETAEQGLKTAGPTTPEPDL